MGVVYHAVDPNIGRPVAIKTIHFGGQRKPEEIERMRERLFREARSAGILSHPGIVTIYDVDQQGELAYIAMEFVDGPTLDNLLSRPQPLPREQMLSILSQTAAALDYAHQRGIVHRDIKPANIMITADGTAKITDFGIAKVAASEQFTMTGTIVGTPHYMSPEQVQGQPIDGRSDQFSLAVIAFEMLTGEKPYTGEHLTTVVYKIVAEEPVPPNRLNPSLSGAIETVLKRGLAKRPDARYRTCQDFIEALDRACANTKAWKTMPRGGSLTEPTLAEAARPPITLPPARRPSREGTATMERSAQRKPGFLSFLFAILVAAALLALIGWRAAPYFFPKPSAPSEADTKPATPAAPPPAPAPSAPAPAATGAGGPQAEAKPSPMPSAPAAANPAPETPQQPAAEASKAPREEAKTVREEPKSSREAAKAEPPKRPASPPAPAVPQPVTVITSPGGATATMDGRPETACKTPCSIDATPGRHSVAVSMDGYQMQSHEVDVGSSPVEMPPLILQAKGGTLMLTSVPTGASIRVNGKPVPKTTPAELPLAVGTYRITVEKDGRQSTQTVQIGSGITVLKVTIQP
jgi:serine/threonine protein kinase